MASPFLDEFTDGDSIEQVCVAEGDQRLYRFTNWSPVRAHGREPGNVLAMAGNDDRLSTFDVVKQSGKL